MVVQLNFWLSVQEISRLFNSDIGNWGFFSFNVDAFIHIWMHGFLVSVSYISLGDKGTHQYQCRGNNRIIPVVGTEKSYSRRSTVLIICI